MSCPPTDDQMPALPDDVLGAIAGAALCAEGSEAGAWCRLSLVNRAFAAGLTGKSSKLEKGGRVCCCP